jgi:DNA repair exonuclease SbcCD ATPase subunit
MNHLVIVVGVLFALFLILSLWLAVSRMKLIAAKRATDSRLIQLEGRVAELDLTRQQLEKRTATPKAVSGKPQKGVDNDSGELVAARKESAKHRDEAQKLRADLRQKENELREARDGVEKRLYVLQEENRRLLEIAKEQDKRLSAGETQGAEQLSTLRAELDKTREELQTERRRANEQERSAAKSSDTLKALQERIAALQSENQKWRDTAADNNGKPLDPAQFFRWQRRALAGRDMYRMMKQLRELSDHKLEVYQSGIERIAAFLLMTAGKPIPNPAPGEVYADRLLGEALGTLTDLGHHASEPTGEPTESTQPSPAASPDATIAQTES